MSSSSAILFHPLVLREGALVVVAQLLRRSARDLKAAKLLGNADRLRAKVFRPLVAQREQERLLALALDTEQAAGIVSRANADSIRERKRYPQERLASNDLAFLKDDPVWDAMPYIDDCVSAALCNEGE